MPLLFATHDGPFHADDVLAFALVRAFVDRDAEVVRSRDPSDWARADIVADVGGEFAPETARFDHHQNAYEGERSSAGMVLDWLEAQQKLSAEFAQELRAGWVDHVDAVDNGRARSESGVLCFSGIVGMLSDGSDRETFDARFRRASDLALDLIEAARTRREREEAARESVAAAMKAAEAAGENVLVLPKYVKWKRAYFELGGADHPTEFVAFLGERDARVVCVPDGPDGDDLRKLPEAWAGLTDADLAEVTGQPGARFCHKNRFIAVFANLDEVRRAMDAEGLWRRATDA